MPAVHRSLRCFTPEKKFRGRIVAPLTGQRSNDIDQRYSEWDEGCQARGNLRIGGLGSVKRLGERGDGCIDLIPRGSMYPAVVGQLQPGLAGEIQRVADTGKARPGFLWQIVPTAASVRESD